MSHTNTTRRTHVTVHVVHGEQGFDRTVIATPSKVSRILAHEFARVERVGRGFVRLEHHNHLYSQPAEMHFEFAPRNSNGGSRWLTTATSRSW